MHPEKQIRIAIVGSGMAGLVTAYLLNKDTEKRYSVTIFEEVGTYEAPTFMMNV